MALVAFSWPRDIRRLIGIFAIEKLNGRDEALQVLLLEEARLGAEGLRDGDSHIKEIKALSGLQQSIAAFVISDLCFDTVLMLEAKK